LSAGGGGKSQWLVDVLAAAAVVWCGLGRLVVSAPSFLAAAAYLSHAIIIALCSNMQQNKNDGLLTSSAC